MPIAAMITARSGGAGNEAELERAEGRKKRCVATMPMRKSSSSTKKRAAMTMPMAHAILLLVAMVLALSLEVAEGRRNKRPDSQRRNMKSRARSGKDFSEFLLVIGGVMACVITPVFGVFLHSLYKDPAVPELARAGWKALKDKTLSYLGQQQQAYGSSPSDALRRPLSSPPTPGAARFGRHTRDDDSNNNTRNNIAGRVPWAPGDGVATSRATTTAASDRLVPSTRSRASRRTMMTSDSNNSSSRSGDRNHREHDDTMTRAEPSLYDYASYGRRDRGDNQQHQQQHQQHHPQQQQQQQQHYHQQQHQHHQQQHQQQQRQRQWRQKSAASMAPHSSGLLLPREGLGWSPATGITSVGDDEATSSTRRNRPADTSTATSRKGVSRSARLTLERKGVDRSTSGNSGGGGGGGGDGGGGGGSGGDVEQRTEFGEREEAYLGPREARWGHKYHHPQHYRDEKGRDEAGEIY